MPGGRPISLRHPPAILLPAVPIRMLRLFRLHRSVRSVEIGIVEGSNGKLMLKDNATRAQAATIMQRFTEKTAE